MLAASETTSQHTITDSKRHQRSSYDTFDSPFRSPSLFGNKPTNNEVLHQFKFDGFAIREEIERYSYQPSPPESFLSMMVDLESSGTLSPKEDCYKEDAYKLYNHHKVYLFNFIYIGYLFVIIKPTFSPHCRSFIYFSPQCHQYCTKQIRPLNLACIQIQSMHYTLMLFLKTWRVHLLKF
jgi:hypothetical protein